MMSGQQKAGQRVAMAHVRLEHRSDQIRSGADDKSAIEETKKRAVSERRRRRDSLPKKKVLGRSSAFPACDWLNLDHHQW